VGFRTTGLGAGVRRRRCAGTCRERGWRAPVPRGRSHVRSLPRDAGRPGGDRRRGPGRKPGSARTASASRRPILARANPPRTRRRRAGDRRPVRPSVKNSGRGAPAAMPRCRSCIEDPGALYKACPRGAARRCGRGENPGPASPRSFRTGGGGSAVRLLRPPGSGSPSRAQTAMSPRRFFGIAWAVARTGRGLRAGANRRT